PVWLLYLDNGDLGCSRNDAVKSADGTWIAFLDGDDLWPHDWLVKAQAAASRDPRFVVWHPEVNLYFGERADVHIHLDMEDDVFRPEMLALENIWTALCFTRK